MSADRKPHWAKGLKFGKQQKFRGTVEDYERLAASWRQAGYLDLALRFMYKADCVTARPIYPNAGSVLRRSWLLSRPAVPA